MQESSRYVIGIDLGTTNSCVAYVDTDKTKNPGLIPQFLPIPQVTSVGVIQNRNTLPSFCYLPAEGEFPEGVFKLPLVGEFAREHGSQVPVRLVESAKSWLCNAAADRKDRILPIQAQEADRISPVEATTAYLRHIRQAWNAIIGKGDVAREFDQQEVVLTVPASFDEVARTLTVEAAKLAEFDAVTLLEEPQAAFYSWIAQHEGDWKEKLSVGDTVLVCDVGGGTTDFSLIEVTEKGFVRMAVGNHLLLGGDNMDRALCYFLEKKLEQQGNAVSGMQWHQLRHQARAAKEKLLEEKKDVQIILQGSGASVVGGSIGVSLTCQEVYDLLVDGFFGKYSFQEALQTNKGSAIRSTGLPYEEEPSITKHLACFLQQTGSDGELRSPSYILFNGGTMKAGAFQESILESLAGWFGTPPKVLKTKSLDLAVGKGAAYFGKVRRGLGVRIGGGSPRSFYLGVMGGEQLQALTILPRGSEEGTEFEAEQTFFVTANQPVSFPLYSSHVRLHDGAGDLIDIEEVEEEMHRLPPIQTVLRFGNTDKTDRKVPVGLGARFTEIGTLELWLSSRDTSHRWSLEFQLKSASGQEDLLATLASRRSDETFDEGFLEKAKGVVYLAFEGKIKPGEVINSLEDVLGWRKRNEWSPSLLRGLWESLREAAPRRFLSAAYEARWWNLAGFFLRPGFGYPLDDFRVKELWKILLGDKSPKRDSEGEIQRWICLRRVAGGLKKGQQMQIAAELMPQVVDGSVKGKGKAASYAFSERVRALASLELIDQKKKIRFGQSLIKRITAGTATKADFWALARIGARHLVYASVGHVVPADVCIKWAEALLSVEHQHEEMNFLLAQLARHTDEVSVNLPKELCDRIVDILPEEPSFGSREQEQEWMLGDQLPVGLTIGREKGENM